MALKRDGRADGAGRGASSGGQAGVSLIELVVAVAMSALVVGMALALFKDIGAAARIQSGGRDDALQGRVLFNALCDNLMSGRGLLALGPRRIRLLNAAGARVEYAWEDSTLTVNGRPWEIRLASLEIIPWGPTLPTGEAWTRESMEYAGLDSLDEDRDGSIDFRELDRDRSGELEPWECRYIARYSLRMETVRQGVATVHAATVHPRNRAREWAEDALDDMPGTGDFGR